MSPLDLVVSWLLTLALHATVLLALAWALERLRVLRHPGWRELAWRGALFGALLSSLLATVAPLLPASLADASPGPLLATPATEPSEGATRPDPAQAMRATLPGESGLARIQAARPAETREHVAAVTGEINPPAAFARWQLPGLASTGLLLAWLLGALAVALRLAAQGLALRRWARRRTGTAPGADSRLPGQVAELLPALGLLKAPRLRLVESLPSPMLMPGCKLLLPAWVEGLAPRQQRAMLAHELAHLQRRDPAWRLAQRLALVPLFFHPLAWLALRRLEALAEDACDDCAAALCGSGRPLAECLAACLVHAASPIPPTPTLAVAMAAEPGPVVRRVKNLLEESPMRRPIPTSLRRTVLAAGLAAALALPGLAITSVANPAYAEGLFSGLFSGTSHTSSNGKDHYVHRNGRTGERIEMTLRGDVGFSEAEDDITTMSPGAEFELSVKRDGVERSLQVIERKGQLQRTYRVDGDKAPYDAAARAWLAGALPDLLRETGMQAEARGQRFLARGGVDALMADMEKIRNDHARGRYLDVLFKHAELDPAGMDRALAIAGKMDSDYELRKALQAGLANQALPPAGTARLLEAATKISSDYELAQLLIQAARSHAPDGPVLDAWRDGLAGISSDYEKRRVLSALLARREPAATRVALEAATDIGSDFESRQVLEQAIAVARDDAGARSAWFTVLAGISSDFEQRQALEALLSAGHVDAQLAGAVLESLDAVGSDFETAQVLRELAAVMPADAALIERYRSVARRLSDHERGQAERALDRFAVAVVD